MVVLLTIRRTTGPGPLTRALFEYAVVFLLAVLVATTGVALDQAPTGGKRASAVPDQRPALVKTIDGFGDWLSQWRDWARKETDRRPQPASATTPAPGQPGPPRPLDQEAAVTLKFSDLNPLGPGHHHRGRRAHLRGGRGVVRHQLRRPVRLARDTGLYSERLTRLWPLLLDAAFIVAQLAAILAYILRGSRAWPILVMVITGALTVWFNLQHAGADPGRRLAAALPPVLMMLAFEIDVQIVKWVMKALGKPLGPIAPPPAEGMLPGAVWRADALGWNVPPNGPPPGWPPGPDWHIPAAHHLPENRHNGQPGLGAGEGGGGQRRPDQARVDRGVPGLARF